MASLTYLNPQAPRVSGGLGQRIPPSGSGLLSPPPLQRNAFSSPNTTIAPMENIMNRKGGLNSSLYQTCLALRRRLTEVPGFETFLNAMDIEEEQESGDHSDPVTSMWNMLRQGYPLMTIYNALQPRVPLEVNSSRVTEAKLGKAATFKFLQACLEELSFPPGECFLITDLYGHDTNGFVKVLRVINRVLDIVQERGLLMTTQDQLTTSNISTPLKRNQQENIIEELVTTERDYVQHLDTLQQFKNELEQNGIISGDTVHDIFLNLNALLDFQRRFLIRIEQQNSLDPSVQNWGLLFCQYKDGFHVYEPFIANQDTCNAVVIREWEKIRAAQLSPAFQGMVTSSTVLISFLMKPFQRLTKYPLLLHDLIKKGDFEGEKLRDLKAGADATKALLDRANSAVDKVKRHQEVLDLLTSVDDWKGHKLDHFGELVVSGGHTVLKGEGTKEVEREYKIFLFERILLCCKEMNPNKPKNRLAGKSLDKRGKPRLQLKGRIFMQNVTDVVIFAKNGSYLLQIFWKGDPGIEHFVIRFLSVEIRDKWHRLVEEQIRHLPKSSRDPSTNNTSQTQFTSMVGPPPENPWLAKRDAEDEDEDERDFRISNATTLIGSQADYTSSRNASTTSLRSRSTTGGSGPPAGPLGVGAPARIPPPRFPIPEPGYGPTPPQLKLSTSFTGTPDDRAGNSYFSPTVESPSSLRSASQASMYPFPRQHTNPTPGWPSDGNKHNTAPPMGRAPLREDESANGYSLNGRNVQRPSLPVLTGPQSAQQAAFAQSRTRSMSSPDVHNQHSPGKRLPNGQGYTGAEEVPVPPIPPHVASMRTPVNRSQTNSPTDNMRRSGTQSPHTARAYTTHYNGYEQSSIRGDARSTPHQGSGLTISSTSQRIFSPVMPATPHGDTNYPSQLKVKIYFEPMPSHVTIVVPIIIKHRSLVDRIDSKMEKITSCSIAKGSARLRYKDTDDEMITIDNDEDIEIALEEWTKKHIAQLQNGNIPDFELYFFESSPS